MFPRFFPPSYFAQRYFAKRGATGTGTQYERPDSDMSVGTWSASPLWSKLDETSPSDSDLISGAHDNSSTCQLSLSNATDPLSSSGHIVRYRYQKNSDAGSGTARQMDLTVTLKQGSMTIASWSHTNIAYGWTTQSQTLSGGEADSITDYTNLNITIVQTGVGPVDAGGNMGWSEVSWVEMELPGLTTPPTTFGVADISALATVSPTGTDSIGPVVIHGDAVMSASATGYKRGVTVIHADVSIYASEAERLTGRVSISAGATVLAQCTRVRFGSSEIDASGTLSALPDDRSALITATGNVVAAATAIHRASASFTPGATMSASAIYQRAGQCSIQSVAYVTANGSGGTTVEDGYSPYLKLILLLRRR